MKMGYLTDQQKFAVKAMARRQMYRWPETKFEITKHPTYADHPSLGGSNKLYINRTTAISLTDRGFCVMSADEKKVWLSKFAMQLVNLGVDIARER